LAKSSCLPNLNFLTLEVNRTILTDGRPIDPRMTLPKTVPMGSMGADNNYVENSTAELR